MPERKAIANFSGGLITNLAPERLPEEATPECQNVYFHKGTVRVRPGRTNHSAVPVTAPVQTTGFRSLFQYVSQTSIERILGVIGTKVFGTHNSSQTFAAHVEYGTTVHVSNKTRFAQFGSNIYFVDGSARVKKITDPSLTTVTEVYDRTAPSVAPALTLSNTNTYNKLIGGDYIFACANYWAAAPNYSPLTITAVYLPPGTYDQVSIDATLDAGPDAVYVYALTPYDLTAFRYIDGLSGPGPGLLTTAFTEVTAFDPYTNNYVYWNGPPTGVHLIQEWNGRMLYALNDYVYISNDGDADTCPQDTQLQSPSPDTGTYFQVGLDGNKVSAFAPYGSSKLIFKERGCWILSGLRFGEFTSPQFSPFHGCASQETIANDGNSTFFLGLDTVWVLTPSQTFENIGKPIKSYLDTYDDTQKRTSWAVLDPVNRRYLLAFPDGYGFSFHLDTGVWTRLQNLPQTCGLYCDQVSTKGIYAGGTALTKLLRLEEGTADETTAIDWSWWSRIIWDVYPGHYLDIREVNIQVLTGSGVANTLTAHIRKNGESADSGSRSLSVPADGDPQWVTWKPGAISGMSSFQIGLTGDASEEMEIGAIEVRVASRGRMR